MSTLHQRAVTQAIALLNAAGAKFCIQHDGQTYGTLLVAEPKRRNVYSWEHLYKDWLLNPKPGAVFSHTCPTRKEAQALRSAVSGQMAHYYGPKAGLSAILEAPDGFRVEAMLVNTTPVEKRK